MATLTASAAQAGAQPLACNGFNVRNVQYALSASLSAGDVIQMCKVPAGAKICGGRVAFKGNANTCTIAVGDGGDVDRYLASVSASATNHWFDTSIQDYSFSAEDTIDIEVGSITAATATGVFELMIMYTWNQEF